MQNLIEQIVNFSQKKQLSKEVDKKNFQYFLEKFYLDNKLSDLENYSIDDLYNNCLHSFKFFIEKRNNISRVRISNPKEDQEGFKAHYTFIDIINKDMPFLVDSIVAYLDKNGFKIKNIIHPVYQVLRNKNGEFNELIIDKSKNQDHQIESIIQLHIDKISDENAVNEVQKNIELILQSVDLIVEDWLKMIDLAKEAQNQIDNSIKIVKDQQYLTEIKDFIAWLINGNFIFLGANEFSIDKNKNDEYQLNEVSGSAFGMFRTTIADFKPQVVNSSNAEVNDSINKPFVIEILKSRYRSRIHRIANAERIRIQKISADGKIIGEYRFIGLFTSSAYVSSISLIPLIRNKVQQVIANSGFVKGSHNYKDLISTLESYPRDELFQINELDLLKNATGIVSICGRSVVRFFAREDKFKRFVSCLVFVPRDQSSLEIRDKIKEILVKAYNGEVADFFVQITESNLIRFHVIIRTNGVIAKVDERKIEIEIEKLTKNWNDELANSVKEKFSTNFLNIITRYKNAFSVSYINRFSPNEALHDIALIQKSLEQKTAIFDISNHELKELSEEKTINNDICEFKIFTPNKPIALSQIMPLLESFGFDVIQEHTYEINIEEDGRTRSITKVCIQYFQLNLTKNGGKLTKNIKTNFEKTISLIYQDEISSGALNRLTINCDLDWQEIFMLRAYSKYLYQTNFRYSQNYFAEAFYHLPHITQNLVKLFKTKFDPKIVSSVEKNYPQLQSIIQQIESDLINVKDVGYDEVIRKFLAIINATTRTNYFQLNDAGNFKGYLSFKFDCNKISHLPLPLPFAEIFVYSSRFEAIHLRGGKVARGGLRWSDRPDDFRTEVLGLMKAQMTKNAVIVPVGSKGGFVIKTDVSNFNRDQILQEAIFCYKSFLSGLLDITDNIINSKIVHPNNVVFYDQADPYLVVAADKGTATFSDIANSVSAQYNFWLGDAFASGGSVGYDHKKMGITAKGAWISVMRHFREMGIDCQNQDFTCVGIGDLSGDVFGNGMLLSRHIKLVCAFNHLHIFLDPNPDVEKSFLERQRMFNLPRSSWTNYDNSLISQGGGIYERSSKSIKITPEVRKILDITDEELSPNDLIKAILKAPVDLIFNGGIGTYVKSCEETNLEVGDKANDLLRINGNELRCKVIGEGGNLGFTQKGRIEFAQNKGMINTDAMDNSAGVDCSDHEVNIKIALISALRANKVDLEQRNKDLEAMTQDVSELVLKDNREQTQAISIAQFQGINLIQQQAQFLDKLEKSGLLNRKIEFLPSSKEIEKRQREGLSLTRPELCVMLAYSKMEIYNQILISDLVNDPYFTQDLLSYFPRLMQEKFSDEIINHQLRKEIITTQITNFVVNKMGITFISQICLDTGFGVVEVVKSFIIACESFGIKNLFNEIEKLDGKINFTSQVKMFVSINKLLERSLSWLLRNQTQGEISQKISSYKKIIEELTAILPEVLEHESKIDFDKKISALISEKIDKDLAKKIANLEAISSAFDIFEISNSLKMANSSPIDLKIIAKIYFTIGTRFNLSWINSSITKLELQNKWQKILSKTLHEDFYFYQMQIAKKIIESNITKTIKINEINSFIENWIKEISFLVSRFDNFINELKDDPNHDLAMFAVALNRLKPLVN